MIKTIIAITILAISSTGYAEMLVDVTKIAGKTKSEINAYLGSPTSCGNSKYGEKCQYEKGEIEIIFINKKADWITIEGIDSVPFSPAALSAIGLKEKKPSFKNNFTLRWDSIQGLNEVSIFKGATNSDYAYIKTKTK